MTEPHDEGPVPAEVPTMSAPWWPTAEEAAVYADWQYEVANGDTVQGFRDWIAHEAERVAAERAEDPDRGRKTCSCGMAWADEPGHEDGPPV